MKKLLNLFACMSLAVLTASCGILGMGANNQTGATNGQASGMALKSLYNQYQTDGKVDVSNLNNIIMLAQLTNGIQGLKGVDDKSEFYNDFAKGLILGSDHLVTKNTASTVTNTLQTLASGTDLSTIAAAGVLAKAGAEETGQQATQTAKQTVQETTTQVSSAAKETVSEAVEMIEDATDEVSSTISSLTSIFGLLGK